MKSYIKMSILPLLFLSGILFAGCYTEIASTGRESDNSDYNDTAYTSDTTAVYDDGAVDNRYYMDDDYRHSRLRLSFSYYYPSYYPSMIGSYYYSYFNDPYWGWGPRYPYNDYGCLYPRPIVYDPWWPYYTGYYPGYYPIHQGGYYHPNYGYNPSGDFGNRKRADGPSHSISSATDRSRPLPPLTSPNPAIGSSPRTREAVPVAETVPVRDSRRAQDEIPWWERKQNERVRSSSGEVQQSGNTRQSDRNRESVNSSPKSTTDQEARPATRQRKSNVRVYNKPSGNQSTGQQEARPASRQRESRQPSYSPPESRSSQPSYSPPSSGGGRSSSSGGSSSGRKRD